MTHAAESDRCSRSTKELRERTLIRPLLMPSMLSFLGGGATYWAGTGSRVSTVGAVALGAGFVMVPFEAFLLQGCDEASDDEISRLRRTDPARVIEAPLNPALYLQERNQLATKMTYAHLAIGAVLFITAKGFWAHVGGLAALAGPGTALYTNVWSHDHEVVARSLPPGEKAPPEKTKAQWSPLFTPTVGGAVLGLRVDF